MAACPVECSTCKEGAAWDGGKSLSSAGYCEYYCSKWGFCGEGEKYQKDPSAVCYECTASKGNNLLSKTIFWYAIYQITLCVERSLIMSFSTKTLTGSSNSYSGTYSSWVVGTYIGGSAEYPPLKTSAKEVNYDKNCDYC